MLAVQDHFASLREAAAEVDAQTSLPIAEDPYVFVAMAWVKGILADMRLEQRARSFPLVRPLARPLAHSHRSASADELEAARKERDRLKKVGDGLLGRCCCIPYGLLLTPVSLLVPPVPCLLLCAQRCAEKNKTLARLIQALRNAQMDLNALNCGVLCAWSAPPT